MTIRSVDLTGDTFIPITSTTQTGFITVSGTQGQLTYGTVAPNDKTKRIGPSLFFKYVKSKLNKTEVKNLKGRLSKLQKLVKDAEEMGQQALFEEFSKMIAVVVREAEISAAGYDKWVAQKDIEKFMSIVRENDKMYINPVGFCKLEQFPRAIPANIQEKIKDVKSKGVFDEFWILYLDYTKENLKTNKEKIRQKDPILFGRVSYDPTKNYYIADWIDQFCDLTLDKFVDQVKAKEPEYQLGKDDEIDEDLIERIKKEVKERHDRLEKTRMSNYVQLMSQEDQANKKTKKSWWKFWS